jgi:hypothetical protein
VRTRHRITDAVTCVRTQLLVTESRTGRIVRQYDAYLRWLYRGGRPNRFARLQNRVSAIAFAVGILPNRAAMLEVRDDAAGVSSHFPW